MSLTVQRDWRRRGILPNETVPGICKRSANGRWTFTFAGLEIIWIINRLTKFGYDLYDATALAGVVRVDMHKAMQRAIGGGENGDGYCRYILVFPSQKESFRPKSDFFRTSDPLQTGNAPAIFTTIDVEKLKEEFALAFPGMPDSKVEQLRAWIADAELALNSAGDA